MLHAIGAMATLLVSASGCALSYVPGAALPIPGFVALFFALYLAAPSLAGRFGDAFDEAGCRRCSSRRCCCLRSRCCRRWMPRPCRRCCCSRRCSCCCWCLAWRSMRTGWRPLFHRRVLRAGDRGGVVGAVPGARNARRAPWRPTPLSRLLFLAVPQTARRRGAPLGRGGPGIVLLAALLCCSISPPRASRTAGLWGMALLLAILNAALFIESASGRPAAGPRPERSLSWVVLFVWWRSAAAAVGMLPSLLVVVVLTLVMVGGHVWALRLRWPPAPRRRASRCRERAPGSLAGAARAPVPARRGGQCRVGAAAVAALRRPGGDRSWRSARRRWPAQRPACTCSSTVIAASRCSCGAVPPSRRDRADVALRRRRACWSRSRWPGSASIAGFPRWRRSPPPRCW